MVRILTNPGKRFFLQLASNAIEDANRFIDSDNMSYTKNAMIRCGLALGIDNTWIIDQFFHLQEIITKHQSYFEESKMPQIPKIH